VLRTVYSVVAFFFFTLVLRTQPSTLGRGVFIFLDPHHRVDLVDEKNHLACRVFV